jgi:hypothetical protein
MFELIGLAATAAAGIGGFVASKDFTKRRLRFVDAIHSRPAPWIAAGIAALAAAPVAWLLPLVGGGTALIFGAGVGLGVRSAQRERHLLE